MVANAARLGVGSAVLCAHVFDSLNAILKGAYNHRTAGEAVCQVHGVCNRMFRPYCKHGSGGSSISTYRYILKGHCVAGHVQ